VPLGHLLLLIVLFPFIDFVLLLWLASRVPFDWTLVWVLGTAVMGGGVLRRERALFGSAMSGRVVVDRGLIEHMAILLAGMLLLLPGVLGDVLGLMLLVPWLRRPLLAWGLGRLNARVPHRFGFDAHEEEEEEPSEKPETRVIDVEVIDPQEDRRRAE